MLNVRGQKVLEAVVESYIARPEPVGSRFISKHCGFELSSATIRNIMADLEDLGFLTQPHTSAGRIPTDKGYRFFVDLMMRDPGLEHRAIARALRKRFEALRQNTEDMIKDATVMLSDITETLAFTLPEHGMSTLNRIHLYRYRGSRLVVVLITNEGAINHRILHTDFGLSQLELNRISDFLNSEFGGRPIAHIRQTLLRQMSQEKELCDILISRAVTICNEALSFPEGDLYMSGLSKLLGLADFTDGIERIVGALEDKHLVLKVLRGMAEDGANEGGIGVIIGSENPDERLRDLSIVTASYALDGRPLGVVGMIGPRRMDYGKVIPLVRMAARFITTSMKQ